jgi:hypothetical protein
MGDCLFCWYWWIADHQSLEVAVRFIDIGKIVDHHCLDVIVNFVDIGWIKDHHCLFYQYQQNKQSPLNSDGLQFNQYQQN